ncbi:MAG: hypothetical protein P1U87_19655 [Verrucomicrobiales bacterium]|nr:hypothetical protein [Verrucomicrobiales bacterium]
MEFNFVLAEASTRYNSLFFVLFLAFAIAAIIWLLLWLFSEGSSGDASSRQSAKAVPAPESKAAPEPEAKTGDSSEGDEDGDFEAATAEEAASLFSAELAAGEVTQDPAYGIIYKDAPAEVDDLKEIKGVAKVLEGKLNGVGVYRFKQVAVWTDAACTEFSKMLTFKNRIYTDNWLAQAKEFHEKKYGEKID